MEFDPYSLLIEPLLDSLFIIDLAFIGLQMIEKTQKCKNFKEFRCSKKTNCRTGLHGFKSYLGG